MASELTIIILSLGGLAQVEVSLTRRIARIEGNVDVLREYVMGKGRKVV